jgi:hypothetical protein
VASIPRLQACDAVADVVAALEAQGAVIVEGLLDLELLARFNAELEPLLAQAQPDRRFMNPPARPVGAARRGEPVDGYASAGITFAPISSMQRITAL